jgi:hypothetical protein
LRERALHLGEVETWGEHQGIDIGFNLVHPHRTPCASWFPVRSGQDASAHLRPQAER